MVTSEKPEMTTSRSNREGSKPSTARILILTGALTVAGVTVTGSHRSEAAYAYTRAPVDGEADQACSERIQAALDDVLQGQAPGTTKPGTGQDTHEAVIAVSELSEHGCRLIAGTVGEDGRPHCVQAEAAFRIADMIEAASADDLPRLRDETLRALTGDASVPRHVIGGHTRLANADLRGLVILEDGATLVLDDVALNGCIVSESALRARPRSDAPPPQVHIEGSVRIDAASFLPDLAIYLPAGALTTADPAARIQVRGDIVAGNLSLTGAGSLHGNVASIGAAELGPRVTRVGHGREPRPWSRTLDCDKHRNAEFLAFPPATTSPSQLEAMSAFPVGSEAR